ncbi:cytochrome P450 [Nocardia sp. NPDC050378]|uniref:cytochrome P450 n=1 Tax=Nocardia sp. NPDC050378 TaxID=3155400 RepID=UPI00340D3C21
MGYTQMRMFRRDPLRFVEDLAGRASGGVFALPWGGWCVSDPELALRVLHDPGFTGGAGGLFERLLPARSSQLGFGAGMRTVLREGLSSCRATAAEAVAQLPSASAWPGTGVELVHTCLADQLLHPQSRPAARAAVEQFVRAGVAIRPQRAWQRARAQWLGATLIAAVGQEVRDRCRSGPGDGPPRDVLDAAIVEYTGQDTDRAAAELLLMTLRSTVATLGHSVAWTMLLASLHQHHSPWPWSWPSSWVVREALRHRPVVWMVGRPVPAPGEFAGNSFTPGEVLSVCPYLLHHGPEWGDPHTFRPERWSEPSSCGTYLPFSSGPLGCSGAALAQQIITEVVTALSTDIGARVSHADTRPIVTSAATTRRFTMHRAPHNP